MAQIRVFSIIGDSNVKRNVTQTNSRACPQLKGCQVLTCHKVQLLDEAVGQLRPESNVCLLACITNFLISSEEDSMVSKRVEPIFEELCSVLQASCSAHPEMSFLITPPMYRQRPLWYREGLPEILTKFSAFMRDKPVNLFLLPSFPTPEFEHDGIHLTAYSGLEYMIHLLDSAVSLLDGLTDDCSERLPHATEATRVLEDRVTVLEQDHRRLNKDVELRVASDAELHDYQENVANESFIVLTGCSRISGQSTKEWQENAKREVGPILRKLMGREVPIEYISNSTGPQPDALIRLNVKLASVEASKAVRVKFGQFYLTGRDKRPEFFKPYSIRNLVTQETRIRIAILQVIGRRYKESNQGSTVKVIGYDPRPILRIIPPQDAQSRRVKSFTFVEAVKKFPTNFSKSDLEFIFSKVGFKQKGLLRSLFICISDDMLPASKKPRQAASSQAAAPEQEQAMEQDESPNPEPSQESTRSRSESRSSVASGQRDGQREESRSSRPPESRSESRCIQPY